MITSIHNTKIQWVRELQSKARQRRAAQAFVVEGVRLVEEALEAGWEAQLVLHSSDLPERGSAIVEQYGARGAPLEQVAPHVLAAASDTQTPQGILAVIGMRSLPLPGQLNFVFIPDGIRDPGNLGTMLRTAAAAGVQAVILPPGDVDPFAPKVVRSAMGAHFRLPIEIYAWETITALVEKSALKVYLADAGGGEAYFSSDFRKPLALIVGGEAQGASPQAQRLAQARVHIPMPGGSESLNAAIASAILLFEVVRQRECCYNGIDSQLQ